MVGFNCRLIVLLLNMLHIYLLNVNIKVKVVDLQLYFCIDRALDGCICYDVLKLLFQENW